MALKLESINTFLQSSVVNPHIVILRQLRNLKQISIEVLTRFYGWQIIRAASDIEIVHAVLFRQ